MTHLPVRPCRLRIASATFALGLCCLAPPGGPAAQHPADSASPSLQATRAALEGLAQRGDDAGRAGGAASRSSAALIQERLSDGDFRPGDRVLLAVEGEPQLPDRPVPAQQPRTIERQLSDTFTVGPAGGLTFPVIGGIALRAVLGAGVEPYRHAAVPACEKHPAV